MSILITGGAGFIGSHTCLKLLERGKNIIILDSFINSKLSVIDRIKKYCKNKSINIDNKIKLFQGDIRDKKVLKDVFDYGKLNNSLVEQVIHFAGLKSISDSIKFPSEYWDVNVNGSINLFKFMNEYNCKKIVFSSSATVYGNSNKGLFNENDKINPLNPYAATKVEIENLLEKITKKEKNSWSVLNLRYFNPIGAHENAIIGEDPLIGTNNLFPLILKVATGSRNKLAIFGRDWETYDGTCIRDFIHVMDLADAHIKGIEFLNCKDNVGIKTINIGTGIGTSVLSLITTFCEVNNCKVPYYFSSRREGDSSKLVANNNLALNLLGWKPNKDLFDMCKDGWNWTCNSNFFE